MSISLYTLHETPVPGEFIIQKFDTDYTCESVYTCTLTECQCPQGHKDRCRHRTMLPMFLKHGHIGDGWFLEWDTRMWRRPINDVSHEPTPLADETVMGTSAGAGEVHSPLPTPGAEAPASPPSPPEGPQPSLSAEAPEPARPVGVGIIVKRRKIP